MICTSTTFIFLLYLIFIQWSKSTSLVPFRSYSILSYPMQKMNKLINPIKMRMSLEDYRMPRFVRPNSPKTPLHILQDPHKILIMDLITNAKEAQTLIRSSHYHSQIQIQSLQGLRLLEFPGFSKSAEIKIVLYGHSIENEDPKAYLPWYALVSLQEYHILEFKCIQSNTLPANIPLWISQMPHLKSLVLENMVLSDADIKKILTSLSIYCPQLQSLVVNGIKMQPSTIEILVSLLKHHSIQNLSLRSSYLGNQGTKILMNGLQNEWKDLIELDLWNTGIGVEGATVLGQSLSKLHLKTLDLGENTRIYGHGLNKMTKLMRQTTIENLSLHAMDLQPGAMMYIIRLLKRNSNIQKLNLFANEWGDVGIESLLKFLKKYKKHQLNLNELNLGWSMVQNEDLKRELMHICNDLGIHLIFS